MPWSEGEEAIGAFNQRTLEQGVGVVVQELHLVASVQHLHHKLNHLEPVVLHVLSRRIPAGHGLGEIL
jgi:hypothetical protein